MRWVLQFCGLIIHWTSYQMFSSGVSLKSCLPATITTYLQELKDTCTAGVASVTPDILWLTVACKLWGLYLSHNVTNFILCPFCCVIIVNFCKPSKMWSYFWLILHVCVHACKWVSVCMRACACMHVIQILALSWVLVNTAKCYIFTLIVERLTGTQKAFLQLFLPLNVGFLSAGVKELPGNAGLFDMALALEWIRDYISFFGGTPNRVTVFGQGTGASSAVLLSLSQITQGSIKAISCQRISPVFICTNPVCL